MDVLKSFSAIAVPFRKTLIHLKSSRLQKSIRKIDEFGRTLSPEYQAYERAMTSKRLEVRSRFEVLAREKSRETLIRFLVHYSAAGFCMTRSVPDWLSRSGQRCIELGMAPLGEFLLKHAAQEDGQDDLHLDDLKSLLVRRGASVGFGPNDSADLIELASHNAGVKAFLALHERNIESDEPWRQIAVDNEIERLSITRGPQFLAHVVGILGFDILDCLGFVQERAALNVDRSYFNMKNVDEFLRRNPASLRSLVSAGEEALEAYATHVEVAFANARGARRPVPCHSRTN